MMRPRALGLRVRRLVIVHRHGDRAPSYNPLLSAAEESYWQRNAYADST